MNKGQAQKKPKIAGLDYLNFPTNETNHPHIYFAGARNLPLSWVMQPIISKTKATPTGSGKSKGSSKGGKGGGGSKDYYGHCLGIVCQLQIDFIWGFLMNNDLAWPNAKLWSSQIYNSGRQIISTDGKVYKASDKTSIDPTPTPPPAPWVLVASPYAAGAYNIGDKVLYLGNVWQNTVAANNLAPGATIPVSTQNTRGVQQPELVNGWFYVSTPDTYNAGTKFWDINSVVAHNGFIWTNPGGGTKGEPGVSGDWIRWKQDLTALANPFKFTVPKNGDVYCYRGTPNQALDTVNEKILSQFGHPPYRNKAGFMLHDFLFGTMQPNPSDMIAMCGRTPVQNIIVGPATLMDSRWQVNPWCVLAEILTNPVCGLGLPEVWFDKATWQAEADRCMGAPTLFYFSPLWTSLSKVHELVADIMSYPDAFIFMSALKNFTAGHWPHNEAGPAYTSANTVDVNSLVDEIQSSSDLWGGTNNSVQVSCSDASAGFTNRPAFAQNLFNVGVIKRMQSTSIDRPHITDFAQAAKWAAEFSKIAGDLTMSGELPMIAEKADGIDVGSIFLLTDDVLGVSLPLRCTRRTVAAAPAGIVRLGYEVERGVAPQPYAPSQPNPVPTTGPAPAMIQNFATIQLPATLGPSSSIAVLAQRTNEQTSELDVWFRQSDATSFQDIGRLSSFGVPGLLLTAENDEITVGSGNDNVKLVQLNGHAPIVLGTTYALGFTGFWQSQVFYSANSGGFPFSVATEGTDYTIDPVSGNITLLATGAIPNGDYVNVKLWKTLVFDYDSVNTPQSDLDLILESMTEDEIADGKIICVCVQNANPALFEMMIVEQVVAAGLNASTNRPVYYVDVKRAQFGTLRGGDGTHIWGSDANDFMFVMRRDGLVVLEHESFAGFQAGSQTMNVRLVPSSAWDEGDVTDVYDPATNPQGLTREFTYQWSNVYAPTVTWGSLQNNGVDIASFAGSFASTDVFGFAFEIDDTNGDLIHAAMVATQGQQEVLLWATNFPPSAQQFKTVNFSLTKGNWTIVMRMLDQAGNQSEQQLTFGGNPVIVYVDNGTATAPVVLAGSYHDSNGFRIGLQFGPLPAAAANFQVYYQLQNRNVALNAGAWIACADAGAVTGGEKWGDSAFGNVIPPIKKGSSGQTLYAYCTQTGKTDSAVVKWNF